MNTRRQTIWLVSMLSIMVVLSAYYLFTEDVEQFPSAGEEFNLNDSDFLTEDVVIQDLSTMEISNENVGTSLTDEQILSVMETQKTMGSGYFTNLQMERDEAFSKEMDQLLSVINDTEQNTEATKAALEQYSRLEDLHQKIDYIEAELMKDYENAIVTEDGEQWKVIVQAEHLEKSEVVSILDLVMNELDIGLSQVTVLTKS